ncbi:hypothetical protein [Aeromonas aquatica]|uniref:hypothetical protein n=1 Tax=Aeromonas aquatica TaxID=558964 RepID=UPI00286FAC64|nr:hypothetical protein [Aeromonas aquatica]
MSNKQTTYTPLVHGSEAIWNRCKIILERQWPQHEIDDWLNMLTPDERDYATGLLQGNHHYSQPVAHDEYSALTRWIDDPPMHQGNLSDAEFKRAIWQKVDEDKWW